MPISPVALLAIPVFLFSLVIHEVAHAWTAKQGGDLTAAYEGRLSLNPLVHLDPIGTAMILIGALTGLPLIGWARPVPVNTVHFRNPNWIIWVALAGPGSNLVLALIAAALWRATGGSFPSLQGNDPFSIFMLLLFLFVFANVCLMIFNLIPIPPLDGSKVFFQLFVRRRDWVFDLFIFLERYGLLVLLLLFFAGPTRQVFVGLVLGITSGLLGLPRGFLS